MTNEMKLFIEGVEFEQITNNDNTVFIFTVKDKMNMIRTGVWNGIEKHMLVTRFKNPKPTTTGGIYSPTWNWYRVVCENGTISIDCCPGGLSMPDTMKKQIEFLKKAIEIFEKNN